MEKGLTQLTDQELLDKKQKAKSNDITNAVIIGMLVGVTIYSTITHGFGFFTFLPLMLAFIWGGKWKKDKDALEKELTSRNLK